MVGAASQNCQRSLPRSRQLPAVRTCTKSTVTTGWNARLRIEGRCRSRYPADEHGASLPVGRKPWRRRDADHASGFHDARRCSLRHPEAHRHYRRAGAVVGRSGEFRRHHRRPRNCSGGDRSHRIQGGRAMSSKVIVLKFGSSVLQSRADLPQAVHEIYRWVRRQYRVVAVVSAFAGETDRLLGTVEDYHEGNPEAIARVIATGEEAATAFLTLELDR